jgi:arginyl-tRNA synthetase
VIGTVLGQSVVNLYRHCGYPVISWNYIGDWGTQFGKLAVAMEKWGNGKAVLDCSLDELLAFYVKFHEEVEKDATLEDQGRAASLKLEQGDKKLRAFWKDVVTVTKKSLKDLYERLHAEFDLELGESFYEDKMEPVLADGKKRGVFTEGKEGAFVVEKKLYEESRVRAPPESARPVPVRSVKRSLLMVKEVAARLVDVALVVVPWSAS